MFKWIRRLEEPVYAVMTLVVVVLLIGAALVSARLSCDTGFSRCVQAVEAWLYGPPTTSVSTYLQAIYHHDTQAALNAWKIAPGERSPNDARQLNERRNRMTQTLMALEAEGEFIIQDIEWWTTCCDPQVTHNPREAGAARIRVQFRQRDGSSAMYIFSVQKKRLVAASIIEPLLPRPWVLLNVYLENTDPLSATATPPTPSYPPPSATQRPPIILVLPTYPILPTSTPTPTDTPLPPTPPANAEDLTAIQGLIVRAFAVQAMAAHDFDLSQFPSVYVNDPQTDIDPLGIAWLRSIQPLVGQRVPAPAAKPGLLDYWRFYFAYWQIGAERQALHRLGTPVSLAAGPIGLAPKEDLTESDKLKFEGTWVTGDRAETVVRSLSALRRYYLVKTPDGWRIANEVILKDLL